VKLGDDHLTVSTGSQVVRIALSQTTTVTGPVTTQSMASMMFEVGASSINMTPASITLTSPSISLMSVAGVVALPMTETIIVPPV
jgi:molybdopterin-binding protein